MKRLLAVLITAVCVSSLPAQDEVSHFDRASKKIITTTGTIQDETVAGIRVKPATGALREIPAADIVNVMHRTKVVPLMYRPPFTAEDNAAKAIKPEEQVKFLKAALDGYQELLPKVAGEKFAVRHLQYKIARIRALLGNADDVQRKQAVSALTAFLKDHPDSWQYVASARLLAQLHLEQGNTGGARQVYEALAAHAKLPKEVKQEAELLTAQMLVRGKQHGEAKKKLTAILNALPPNDPQRVRVEIYMAECDGNSAPDQLDAAIAKLDDIIRKTASPELKALAYNAQGDAYQANGRARDALWPYLWVDVHWNQDRQEHFRAVSQLAKLFEEIGDMTRAKQYQEKMNRLK